MALSAWIGPAIVAALISGIIGLLSLFVSGRIHLGQDRRRRDEKVIDYQVALRAEIRSELHQLSSIDFDIHLKEIEDRYAVKPGYSVRASHSARHIIFEALSSEIYILPEDVIDPVIVYSRQRYAIERFAEDLRMKDFIERGVEQQLEMYRDLIGMQRHLCALAGHAVAALDRSLGRKRRINNPVSGRSDPG